MGYWLGQTALPPQHRGHARRRCCSRWCRSASSTCARAARPGRPRPRRGRAGRVPREGLTVDAHRCRGGAGAATGPAGRPDPADVRPGSRGAVQLPRSPARPDRCPGARPVRRDGRGGPGGPLAGAALAVLVESDRAAAETLHRNVETVGLPGALVVRRAVAAYLTTRGRPRRRSTSCSPTRRTRSPTTIFEILATVGRLRWLAPGGVVVVERSVRGPEIRWPEASSRCASAATARACFGTVAVDETLR